MTRVLAAALLSVMTVAASAGLASAATQSAAPTANQVGTSTVTAPTTQSKVLDASKPVTHKKKDKAASATVSPTVTPAAQNSMGAKPTH